jgi:hypothetical protein
MSEYWLHSSRFDVAHDSTAPACEVVSAREWLASAADVRASLYEVAMDVRMRLEGDTFPYARHRLQKTHDGLVDARNLLTWAMVLVVEDSNLEGTGAKMPDGSQARGLGFDQPRLNHWASDRALHVRDIAAAYGATLHTHYLAAHPELLKHRQWAVMQALGGSFTAVLVAQSDMAAIHRALVENNDEQSGASER